MNSPKIVKSANLPVDVFDQREADGKDGFGRSYSRKEIIGLTLMIMSAALIAIGTTIFVLVARSKIHLPQQLTKEVLTTRAISFRISRYVVNIPSHTFNGYKLSMIANGLFATVIGMSGSCLFFCCRQGSSLIKEELDDLIIEKEEVPVIEEDLQIEKEEAGVIEHNKGKTPLQMQKIRMVHVRTPSAEIPEESPPLSRADRNLNKKQDPAIAVLDDHWEDPVEDKDKAFSKKDLAAKLTAKIAPPVIPVLPMGKPAPGNMSPAVKPKAEEIEKKPAAKATPDAPKKVSFEDLLKDIRSGKQLKRTKQDQVKDPAQQDPLPPAAPVPPKADDAVSKFISPHIEKMLSASQQTLKQNFHEQREFDPVTRKWIVKKTRIEADGVDEAEWAS